MPGGVDLLHLLLMRLVEATGQPKKDICFADFRPGIFGLLDKFIAALNNAPQLPLIHAPLFKVLIRRDAVEAQLVVVSLRNRGHLSARRHSVILRSFRRVHIQGLT